MRVLALAFTGWMASVATCSEVWAQERDGPRRTKPFELRWIREDGAGSCVSGAALARLLAQVTGPSVDQAGPSLLLDGYATPASAPLRYRIRIAVRERESGELLGERELTTTENGCSALTQPVLLILAMSVDPGLVRDGLPEEVADELRRHQEEDVDVWPASSALAPPRDAPEPRVVAASLERDRWQEKPRRPPPPSSSVTIEAGVAASAQVLPNPSPGLTLGVLAPVSADYAVSVAASGFWPAAVKLPASPYLVEEAVSFHAAAISAAACRRTAAWRNIRIEACAGAGLGVRWLASHALANKGNPYRAFFGPELGLTMRYRLSPSWLLGVGARGLLSLRDDRFVYQAHDGRERELFAPGLITAQAFLAAGRSW